MEELAKRLSITFEKMSESSVAPTDRITENITLIFKKDRKEDLRNYSPISLTSVPGKIMHQILVETTLRHMENKVIGDSQLGFTIRANGA